MKNIFLLLITFFVLFFASASKSDIPVFYVHFTVITKNSLAQQVATIEKLKNEIEILNANFVTELRQPIVKFKFKSASLYHDIRLSTCNFISLGDNTPYDSTIWNNHFNQCNDPRVRDPYAINFFVYDSLNDATGHGVRNSNSPYILIDWVRLNHVQASEEHEMGHAFGLTHLCSPSATPKTSTNIMSSADNCLGSGGLRNIGFNQSQLSIINNYAWRIWSKINNTTCFFGWAETQYPNLFSPKNPETQFISPHIFRIYSKTISNLGISIEDNHVYYSTGLSSPIQDLGFYSTWVTTAKCPH